MGSPQNEARNHQALKPKPLSLAHQDEFLARKVHSTPAYFNLELHCLVQLRRHKAKCRNAWEYSSFTALSAGANCIPIPRRSIKLVFHRHRINLKPSEATTTTTSKQVARGPGNTGGAVVEAPPYRQRVRGLGLRALGLGVQ